MIPKDKAISILNNKLKELITPGFNWKVWQNTTTIDMKQIFGTFSDQSLQISHINFISAYLPPEETVPKGREDAAGLLKSYIQQIENYSQIADQKIQITHQSFEKKYYELADKYNQKISENRTLATALTSYNEELANFREELSHSKIEIKRLEDDTLQLENITLINLWNAILKLPFKSIWPVILVFLSILTGAFFLGEFIYSVSHPIIHP